MYHYIVYRVIGYISLVVGLCATACIFKLENMFYAIALAIFGFILSVLNIYWNTKYYQEREKWPMGYLGMFFSSIPV
ncbi:MAG: hypothetical protein K0S32_3751, partial [Bacteroidetes bacterium]|nr:hypothetical protein [Bacteroidota bacterium]